MGSTGPMGEDDGFPLGAKVFEPLSPRQRMQSRGAARERKHFGRDDPPDGDADTAASPKAEAAEARWMDRFGMGSEEHGLDACKAGELCSDGLRDSFADCASMNGSSYSTEFGFDFETKSSSVSSRSASPRKRRETHPALSPVNWDRSEGLSGAWEDHSPCLQSYSDASTRLPNPRKRRILQRYMRFSPLRLNDEDSEAEEDDGQDVIMRVNSEPSPAMRTMHSLGWRRPRALRRLAEEDEVGGQKSPVKRPTAERFFNDGTEGDESDAVIMRQQHPGPAPCRRESFHSLGTHVSWTILLEFAGDNRDAWAARKVHRWLGMSERDTVTFLSELVELRDALNKGEEPDKQAGPEAAPHDQTVCGSSDTGFFGWIFGHGSATPDADPPPRALIDSGRQSVKSEVGFFSWLFGAGPYEEAPSRPRPARAQHTDTVEYRLERLEEVGLLGRGAFGQVTLVRCGVTGQLLALKAVSKGMLVEMQLQQTVAMEKAVMQAASSQFLVKVAATFNRQEQLFLLLEAVMGGDLYTVYRRYNCFGSEEHARFYAGCVLCAFEHLHSKRILYRDLKMENVVLDLRGYCKLCDFGTATFKFDMAYTMCGTCEYMSPEVICGFGHGAAADWWTLGVLIYEMIMSVTPFVEEEPLLIFAKAKAGIEKVNGFADNPMPWAHVVRGLCKHEPSERLPMLAGGVENAKSQDWFLEVGFDWAGLEAGTMDAPHVPTCEGPEDLCNFAGEEQELPLQVPYKDEGDGWDKDFEDPVGPRYVAQPTN